MKTEIKPARNRAPYGFAKWEPPAKFLRESPRDQRNIPFAEDKDYLYMDGFDKGVALALAFGALVILGLNIWEWLQ